MKINARVILLVILLAVAAAVYVFAPRFESVSGDVTVQDVYMTPEGYSASNDFAFKDDLDVKHHLSEYSGKNVIVMFWVSWNEKARNQLKLFDECAASNPGTAFLAVNGGKNAKDSLKKALSVYSANDYYLPLYVDKTGVTANNITDFPQYFVFDGSGELIERIKHSLTSEELSELAEKYS